MDVKHQAMLRSLRIDRFRCERCRLESLESCARAWIRRPEHVVIYAATGMMDVELEVGRGEVKRLTGPCFYIPAGVRRRGIVRPEGGCLELRYAYLMVHVCEVSDLLSRFEIRCSLSSRQEERFVDLHERALSLAVEADPAGMTHLWREASMAMELMALLLDGAAVKPASQESAQAQRRLERVFGYIHENIGRELSIEELAAVACVSQATLHRMFKKATGVPPLGYVRRMRLNQAADLLLANRYSIAEIAARLGYADAFCFSKSFKKQFGVSPSQFHAGPV